MDRGRACQAVTMAKGFDITHWSPRRLQQVTILVVSALVLGVVIVAIMRGWLWALAVAVVLAIGVLRPMRAATVRWWEANHPDGTGREPS